METGDRLQDPPAMTITHILEGPLGAGEKGKLGTTTNELTAFRSGLGNRLSRTMIDSEGLLRQQVLPRFQNIKIDLFVEVMRNRY